jgi:hypothetical protein
MEGFVGVNDAKTALQSPKSSFNTHSEAAISQVKQLFWVGWVVSITKLLQMVSNPTIRRKKSRPTSITSIN